MKPHSFIKFGLTVIATSVLTACGGSGDDHALAVDPTPTPNPVPTLPPSVVVQQPNALQALLAQVEKAQNALAIAQTATTEKEANEAVKGAEDALQNARAEAEKIADLTQTADIKKALAQAEQAVTLTRDRATEVRKEIARIQEHLTPTIQGFRTIKRNDSNLGQLARTSDAIEPVSMNVPLNPALDTVVVAVMHDGKKRKLGYLEDFDFRMAQSLDTIDDVKSETEKPDQASYMDVSKNGAYTNFKNRQSSNPYLALESAKDKEALNAYGVKGNLFDKKETSVGVTQLGKEARRIEDYTWLHDNHTELGIKRPKENELINSHYQENEHPIITKARPDGKIHDLVKNNAVVKKVDAADPTLKDYVYTCLRGCGDGIPNNEVYGFGRSSGGSLFDKDTGIKQEKDIRFANANSYYPKTDDNPTYRDRFDINRANGTSFPNSTPTVGRLNTGNRKSASESDTGKIIFTDTYFNPEVPYQIDSEYHNKEIRKTGVAILTSIHTNKDTANAQKQDEFLSKNFNKPINNSGEKVDEAKRTGSGVGEADPNEKDEIKFSAQMANSTYIGSQDYRNQRGRGESDTIINVSKTEKAGNGAGVVFTYQNDRANYVTTQTNNFSTGTRQIKLDQLNATKPQLANSAELIDPNKPLSKVTPVGTGDTQILDSETTYQNELGQLTVRNAGGTIAEVYGARTFPRRSNNINDGEGNHNGQYKRTGNRNNSLSSDDDGPNLPLENTKLNFVQYGRVTSQLSNLDIKQLRPGAQDSTYIVAYGQQGDKGTEDHYFYRGRETTTPEQIAQLKETHSDSNLIYQGHAVTYGMDHNYGNNGYGNSVGQPYAFQSGTHVIANVNLDSKEVKGNLHNKWRALDENGDWSVKKTDVLVDFNGRLKANGDIAGTSNYRKAAEEENKHGSFHASLYGKRADEMGGSVASNNTDSQKAWGASFGAVLNGTSGLEPSVDRWNDGEHVVEINKLKNGN